VSDDQIREAIVGLARETGVFAEPAAAASFAGLVKSREAGLIRDDETALVLVTGSGLKDIDAPRRLLSKPLLVPPSLDELKREMAGRGEEGRETRGRESGR